MINSLYSRDLFLLESSIDPCLSGNIKQQYALDKVIGKEIILLLITAVFSHCLLVISSCKSTLWSNFKIQGTMEV